MDRDDKLDCIFEWLAIDCRCDLVCVDEEASRIILECWTTDHRAFRVQWDAGAFDLLSLEELGNQVQRSFRKARAFHAPAWT